MKEFLTDAFVDWQKRLRQRKTVTEFAAYVGVSRDVMNNWITGRRLPNGESVRLLAEKLGEGIYDVDGFQHLHPDIQEITAGWGDLTEAQQQALLDQLEAYRQQNSRGRNSATTADTA